MTSALGAPVAGSRYLPVRAEKCSASARALITTQAGAYRSSSTRSSAVTNACGPETAPGATGARGWRSGGHRRGQCLDEAGDGGAALEDAVLAVHCAEQLRRPDQVFGGSEKQVATGVQGVVEQTVHVFLDIGLEVDQQVAAHDEVETGERWVLDQVVDGEETHLPDFLRDLIHMIVPDEESLQALRRDVLGDAFGVAAVARELQRLVVDVPGEDLHPRARVVPQNLLSEQDRHRVRFLAGRAAGRPHPEGPVQRCDVHEARDHITGQYGECLWVSEEVRHADEQIAEQLVRFARAIAQPLDVCRN